jgi:protein TonB
MGNRAGRIALGLLVMALSSHAAARNKAEQAKPIQNPGEWFGSSSYPVEAIRASAEGRTVARLTIDERGLPVRCDVVTSAGNEHLDKATCDLAMVRARFTPARDEHGRPISSVYMLPVRWALPDHRPLIALDDGRRRFADHTIEISLDENGTVKGCKVVKLGADLPDPCLTIPLGGRPFARAQKDGKPVPATVTMTLFAYMDAD